jgi:transposase-like protein
MKLIDVTKAFASDEQCLAYLEAMRWPNGVRCPVCGADKISKITRKSTKENKRTQLYQCLEKTCNSQFSVTAGTIFHDSHLPLNKWFMAIALLVDAKKSMSALQLSRHLRCNYRTAWYLAHRIREAMVDNNGPKLSGVVEVDETYIGGKQRGHKGKKKNKDVVIGVRERGGALRLVHTKDASAESLYNVVAAHVSKDAQAVMTDEKPRLQFPPHAVPQREALTNPAQGSCVRERRSPHEHRGIRILAAQAWPDRVVPSGVDKASPALSERVWLSVQSAGRCGHL